MNLLQVFLILCLAVSPSLAATRLLVTVIERKSGKPVVGLKAGEPIAGAMFPILAEA